MLMLRSKAKTRNSEIITRLKLPLTSRIKFTLKIEEGYTLSDVYRVMFTLCLYIKIVYFTITIQ